MLNIHTLPLGDYQTNTYIVHKGDTCVIIDPGYEPERILAEIARLGLTVGAILLTHGHFDHVGGVRFIAKATACPVYLCEEDLSLPPYMTSGALFFTDGCEEGDTVSIAEMAFSVLHTPGHTPGSVCYLIDDALFSGDTLFQGSCGRTDFPGSSGAQMRKSLDRLSALPDRLAVYPGHGPSTTLEDEKRYNPYL